MCVRCLWLLTIRANAAIARKSDRARYDGPPRAWRFGLVPFCAAGWGVRARHQVSCGEMAFTRFDRKCIMHIKWFNTLAPDILYGCLCGGQVSGRDRSIPNATRLASDCNDDLNSFSDLYNLLFMSLSHSTFIEFVLIRRWTSWLFFFYYGRIIQTMQENKRVVKLKRWPKTPIQAIKPYKLYHMLSARILVLTQIICT